MAGRRTASRRTEWTPPTDAQLVVLERQICDAITEAADIKSKPYGNDGWSPWSRHIGDLVDRAFGPDSPQAHSMNRFSFGGKPDRLSDEVWRNGLIDEKLEAAERVVKAIPLELERRGASIAAPSLPIQNFGKITDPALRSIAERNYDELRAIAGSTTMAAALPAGGVVEAVLYDALQKRGFKSAQLEKMRLVDLVDEAFTSKTLRARAKTAGHAVRETRNLIHPAVEIRDGRLTKNEAQLVIALLQIVLEEVL